MLLKKDVGFLRWAAWALFSPTGRILRLPYLGGRLLSMFLGLVYSTVIYAYWASAIVPDPAGGLSKEHLATVVGARMVPQLYLLPTVIPLILLDMKRLRGIGGPAGILGRSAAALLLALICNLAMFFWPAGTIPGGFAASALQYGGQLFSMVYLLILLLVPDKELARAEAAENARRAREERFQRKVGADAERDERGRRRLPGSAIKEWRVISPPADRDK